MFSGGAGSWAAAKRLAESYGTDGLVLLFADTLIEDEDNYRFLDQAAENVGGTFVRLTEGRDPWQVFFDERFLGNTRADPCSRVLKRSVLRGWVEQNCDPLSTVVYLGIDWSEVHRFERAKPHWEPWQLGAPLCDRPYLDKRDALAWLRSEGIEPPRLYAAGFQHANCGGFCVKAGQAHFANLLRFDRKRYLYHEEREQQLRAYLDADVAILRDRTGGATKPMTLRAFRERVEAQGSFDADEWGGCSCLLAAGPT